MAAEYARSEALEGIARAVMEEFPQEFSHLNNCRIAYQVCNHRKTKSGGMIVYADTEKVRYKHKGLLPYDFIITFYADGDILDEEIQKRLMYHELKHVGYDAAEESCYIIPHDLEDFRDVINKWGTDWIRGE